MSTERLGKKVDSAELTRQRTLEPYVLVRLLLAGTLFAAAALKGYELSMGQPHENLVLGSRTLSIALVQAELLLGAWLISGFARRTASYVTLGAFVVFFGTALHKALEGGDSCGCFGAVRVHPLLVLAFDLIAVAAIIRWSAISKRPVVVLWHQPALRAAFMLIVIGAVAVGTLAMVSYAPAEIGDGGEILGYADFVDIRPGEWLGRRLPLLEHIDSGKALADGEWVLVFHHHRCQSCRHTVAQFKRLASDFAALKGAPRIALIELAPYDPGHGVAEDALAVDVLGRLSESKYWGMPLPTVLRLEDGTVTALTSFAKELIASTRLHRIDAAPSNPFPGPSEYSAARKRALLSEVACGPLSLISVLERIGVDLTPADKEAMVQEAGSHGTDLAQLRALAEEFGAHASGAELSIDALRQLGLPAVVFMRGTGFAAVTDYSDSGLDIVYPLVSKRFLPDEHFQQDFGKVGTALLVSLEPIPLDRFARSASPSKPHGSASGPLLHLSKSMLTIGRIHRYAWDTAMVLRNDGDQTLKIQDVFCSSPSLTATVGNANVAPGQSTTLNVSGEQKHTGTFTEDLVLITNSRSGRATKIPVRGHIRQPVFFPRPAVLFDPILEGHVATALVPFDIEDGVALGSLLWKVSGTSMLHLEPVASANEGAMLRVRCRAPVDSGWHRFRATVSVDSAHAVESSLDIAVHVVPLAEALPPTLWIRDEEIEGLDWERRVVVRHNRLRGAPMSYEWSDPVFSEAVDVRNSTSATGDIQLCIAPRGQVARRNWTDTSVKLIIRSEDSALCEVVVRMGGESLRKRSANVVTR